jgi:hypothetical protein
MAGQPTKMRIERRVLFEVVECPALQPLPAKPFEYAEWKRCRVVEARITDRTVEIFPPRCPHRPSR